MAFDPFSNANIASNQGGFLLSDPTAGQNFLYQDINDVGLSSDSFNNQLKALQKEHETTQSEYDYHYSNSAERSQDTKYNSTDSSPLNMPVTGGAHKMVMGSPENSTSSAEFEKDKSRSRGKRQYLDAEDAKLIAKDDSELTEEEFLLKRKAQNRAAQRAFRERKEMKLREFEDKLNKSEEERLKLLKELDVMRQRNIPIQTENEISNQKEIAKSSRYKQQNNLPKKFNFPRDQREFSELYVYPAHTSSQNNIQTKVYMSPDIPGEKVLTVGALWDYLVLRAEKLDHQGVTLDVAEVMGKLKGHEKCHGHGPAYSIEDIDHVIERLYSLQS